MPILLIMHAMQDIVFRCYQTALHYIHSVNNSINMHMK